LFAVYTGRGPTRARTTVRDGVVVCITEDNMTKAERRLTQEGEVELLTGRRVVAFLSDHDAGADMAAEVFVLDGAPHPSEAPTDVGGAPAVAPDPAP
jgi:uncharacterized protein YbcI